MNTGACLFNPSFLYDYSHGFSHCSPGRAVALALMIIFGVHCSPAANNPKPMGSGAAAIPARLGIPLMSADGGCSVVLNGEYGKRYQILTSTDLINWSPMVGLHSLSPSEVIFDPQGNTGGRRFYKAVSSPEFPLKEYVMTFSNAYNYPYNSGPYLYYYDYYGSKPSQLRAEPAQVSAKPLYCFGYNIPILGRLDSSTLPGTNYDRLILDLNGNYDLTDDPVWPVQTIIVSGTKHNVFGPIRPAAGGQATNFQYGFYCDANFYDNGDKYAYTYLYPASRFEADVTLGTRSQKFVLLNGDANGHLGDYASATRIYWNPNQYYYTAITSRDWLLRDFNNSGAIDYSGYNREKQYLAKVIHIQGKPYSFFISPTGQAIQLEPYIGPVGYLAPVSKPEVIQDLELVRQAGVVEGEPMVAEINQGRLELPAGNYQLYATTIYYNDNKGRYISAQGILDHPRDQLVVSPGQSTSIACGSPIAMQVVADKSTNGSQVTLNLTVKFVGAYEETFSGISVTKNYSTVYPVLKITDDQNKLLESSNLSFG